MRPHETTMKAIVVTAWGELALRDVPVPAPGPSQVLIRVLAAPINPADLLFAEGNYPSTRQLPAVGGTEASGVVAGAGASSEAQALMGCRVSCVAGGSGTWAEYSLAEAAACIPLPDEITDHQGAMLIANPISAMALMDIAQKAGTPAIVQTAAAGALGQMLERLGRRNGMRVINLVRREEQADTLRRIGAKHVLVTGETGWQERLTDLAHELGARFGVDAVGGALTGQVLACMPPGSRISVYGLLSLEDCRIRLADLVFKQKSVDGFWLGPWLMKEGRSLQSWRDTLLTLVRSDLRSEVQLAAPLADGLAAIETYRRNMNRGKVLLLP